MIKSKVESRFTPKKKPKNLRKTIVRLLKYFEKEKKILILLTLMVLLDSLLVISIPLLIGKSIDLIDINRFDPSIFTITIIAL